MQEDNDADRDSGRTSDRSHTLRQVLFDPSESSGGTVFHDAQEPDGDVDIDELIKELS